MSSEYAKPSCIAFYNAYDSVIKKSGLHREFLSFVMTEIDQVQSKKNIHNCVVNIFIDFVFQKVPSFLKDPSNSLYEKIFRYCWNIFFKGSSIPSDSQKIKKILFKSKKRCLSFFDKVQVCKNLNEFLSYDNEEVQCVVDEFIFIRAFSKFIYSCRNKNDIEFFKRFFRIYPFDRESSPSKKNIEWINKHETMFNTIKNYINVPTDKLKLTREWFKKQLIRVDFAAFSELQKSVFYTEMFVTFGNISAKKTGDPKGYRISLKKLFYLGRYYNIHQLPLTYIKKEQKTIENIAHDTWRRVCGFKPTTREEFDKAQERKSKRMVQAEERELYDKKAPRVDMKYLERSFPYMGKIEKKDNYETVFQKMTAKADSSKMLEVESCEDVLAFLRPAVEMSGIKNILSTEDKKRMSEIPREILSIFLKDIFENTFWTNPYFSVYKPGTGLITHYDMHESYKKIKDQKSFHDGFLKIFLDQAE